MYYGRASVALFKRFKAQLFLTFKAMFRSRRLFKDLELIQNSVEYRFNEILKVLLLKYQYIDWNKANNLVFHNLNSMNSNFVITPNPNLGAAI